MVVIDGAAVFSAAAPRECNGATYANFPFLSRAPDASQNVFSSFPARSILRRPHNYIPSLSLSPVEVFLALGLNGEVLDVRLVSPGLHGQCWQVGRWLGAEGLH